MRQRTLHSTFALCLATAVILAISCSDEPAGPQGTSNTPEDPPNSYPAIPRPTTADEIIPDESEAYVLIVPVVGKDLDFAPTWSDATFNWDIDIQTWYERCLPICGLTGDPIGNYFNGNRLFLDLVFEGGVVNLTTGVPATVDGGRMATKRLLFIEDGGVLGDPRNPEMTKVTFDYVDYPNRTFTPALYAIKKGLQVTPEAFETQRWRFYNAAALSCPQLTTPVYLKRERYWKRLPLGGDGNNLKSIRVDPGTSFSVSYTRTHGTSITNSYTFTRSLNAEITAQLPSEVLGAKLGGSLSEAFETSVEISEESSVTIERTMTGMDGKTVIYSVWTTVEAYSIVDEDGNTYTDPSFSFNDLGNTAIVGEYEWLSSTAFDYE